MLLEKLGKTTSGEFLGEEKKHQLHLEEEERPAPTPPMLASHDRRLTRKGGGE